MKRLFRVLIRIFCSPFYIFIFCVFYPISLFFSFIEWTIEWAFENEKSAIYPHCEIHKEFNKGIVNYLKNFFK